MPDTDVPQENDVPVEIREMELEDLPKVYALGEVLFRPEAAPNLYRTWDEYELIDYYSGDGEFCLVAEQDSRIVGFTIGTIIDKRRSAWTYGYLVWLGVEPGLEGHGVARRLVNRLTDLFIEEGVRMMMVDTDADNARALSFFGRLGFGQPDKHVYLTKNLTGTPAYKRYKAREDEQREIRRKERKARRRAEKAAKEG